MEFSEILFFHHPAVPRDLIGSNRHIEFEFEFEYDCGLWTTSPLKAIQWPPIHPSQH